MVESLTRLGVDLGGPTLVAFAVVALVAGLLGTALGSVLELLRTWRLQRAMVEHEVRSVSYDEPAVAFAYGGGLDAVASEPGLEDWFTGHGTRPRPQRTQLGVLVVLALLVVVTTFGAAAALLGLVPPAFTGG